MFGRYTFEPTAAVYTRFQLSNRLEALVPRYNIAPGQMVPVIIAHRPRPIGLMRWGLIPQWAQDAKTAYKMINARVETLTQRPAFRGLLSHHRCVVPASGFYEWTGEGRAKRLYYILSRRAAVSRVCRPLRCVEQWTRGRPLHLHHHHDRGQ